MPEPQAKWKGSEISLTEWLEREASEHQTAYEKALERRDWKSAAGLHLKIEAIEWAIAERFVRQAKSRLAEYRFEGEEELRNDAKQSV